MKSKIVYFTIIAFIVVMHCVSAQSNGLGYNEPINTIFHSQEITYNKHSDYVIANVELSRNETIVVNQVSVNPIYSNNITITNSTPFGRTWTYYIEVQEPSDNSWQLVKTNNITIDGYETININNAFHSFSPNETWNVRLENSLNNW